MNNFPSWAKAVYSKTERKPLVVESKNVVNSETEGINLRERSNVTAFPFKIKEKAFAEEKKNIESSCFVEPGKDLDVNKGGNGNTTGEENGACILDIKSKFEDKKESAKKKIIIEDEEYKNNEPLKSAIQDTLAKVTENFVTSEEIIKVKSSIKKLPSKMRKNIPELPVIFESNIIDLVNNFNYSLNEKVVKLLTYLMKRIETLYVQGPYFRTIFDYVKSVFSIYLDKANIVENKIKGIKNNHKQIIEEFYEILESLIETVMLLAPDKNNRGDCQLLKSILDM